MASGHEGDATHPRTPFQVERVGAFIDAVVAIAMTLLILPLMESVGEVAKTGDDTVHWFAEHDQQLVSFIVSFVLIAMFWMIHHRIFTDVARITMPLMWLLVAWLLTIVWLPVATAISGAMDVDDAWAKVVYIGSLIATSLVSLAIRLYLRRNAWLRRDSAASLDAGIVADISTAVLFGCALAISLVFPQLGYYPLFVMMAGPFVQALLLRLARRRHGARS